MTRDDALRRLSRSGLIATLVLLAASVVIATAMAQPRETRRHRGVGPPPVARVLPPQGAGGAMPSWAWASMATPPVWSDDDRFDGPLNPRIPGPGLAVFTFP
jgi:hypothetical protein